MLEIGSKVWIIQTDPIKPDIDCFPGEIVDSHFDTVFHETLYDVRFVTDGKSRFYGNCSSEMLRPRS